MSCLLFKLRFLAPVHFGSGDGALSLYGSEEHFRADTLFSALCHTALTMGGEAGLSELISLGKDGSLRLSDAMPWRDETLYLPKPCVSGEKARELPARLRKAVKKLKWIPVEDFSAFSDSVQGGEAYVPSDTAAFGVHEMRTRAAVSDGEDAMPYDVGVFRFLEDCGLWFLCLCPEAQVERMEKLVAALGLSGIGGKISSGCGSFAVEDFIYLDEPFDPQTEWLSQALQARTGRYLLLSSCLPGEEELDAVIPEASFQVVRRGGFVQSESHAPEPLKKDTQYFISAGAVLTQRFRGDLFSVGSGGTHPVYRYSRPVFLGVSL